GSETHALSCGHRPDRGARARGQLERFVFVASARMSVPCASANLLRYGGSLGVLPLPALCGERVGVRGMSGQRLARGRAAPHPPSLRSGTLSPQARGEGTEFAARPEFTFHDPCRLTPRAPAGGMRGGSRSWFAPAGRAD